MNLIEQLNFEALDAQCIWLIGKNDINIDILWSFANFEYTNDINSVENFALFEDRNLKCIFKNEYANFLQNAPRKFWNKKLIIKGAEDSKFAQKEDAILNFEAKFNVYDLARAFANIHNIIFTDVQWEFIKKYAKNLKDLVVLNILNEAEIEIDNWAYFLDEAPSNWYAKFKKNELLEDAIVDEVPIPVLQYLLRADSNAERKGMMQFLLANIKNGGSVWGLNAIWKDLVSRVYIS